MELNEREKRAVRPLCGDDDSDAKCARETLAATPLGKDWRAIVKKLSFGAASATIANEAEQIKEVLFSPWVISHPLK